MAKWINASRHKFTAAEQLASLNHYFPSGRMIALRRDYFEWTIQMHPTEISQEYRMLLRYSGSESRPAKIYVLEPKIQEPKSILDIHMFSDKSLCLYYPSDDASKKWSKEKLISQTLMPWAAEWLFYYEVWLATGNWEGGGVHPVSRNKDLPKE